MTSLNDTQENLVKKLYQNFAGNPLNVGDPFYEPIYKPTPDAQEPIDRLEKHIKWSEVGSCQFFSGFRGKIPTSDRG